VFDKKFNISVNLDKIKHIPEILPGDLLVLRGTTIHKTQDTDTHRVAVSIRLTSSFDKINKNILLAGSQTKQRYMSNNSKIYQNMHNFFDSKNIEETSAYEIFGEFHNRIKQLSENIN
jgi:ectoine hydroxylase-related dioxygenase (phytanoyl-CoA dioxygenase family)